MQFLKNLQNKDKKTQTIYTYGLIALVVALLLIVWFSTGIFGQGYSNQSIFQNINTDIDESQKKLETKFNEK